MQGKEAETDWSMTLLRIDALTPADWEPVRRIYLEGLASGQASFEVNAPTWGQWNAAHLPHSRLVMRAGNQVAAAGYGWRDLPGYLSANARAAGESEP